MTMDPRVSSELGTADDGLSSMHCPRVNFVRVIAHHRRPKQSCTFSLASLQCQDLGMRSLRPPPHRLNTGKEKVRMRTPLACVACCGEASWCVLYFARSRTAAPETTPVHRRNVGNLVDLSYYVPHMRVLVTSQRHHALLLVRLLLKTRPVSPNSFLCTCICGSFPVVIH